MGLSVPSLPFPFESLIISFFICRPKIWSLYRSIYIKKKTIKNVFKTAIPKKLLVVAKEGGRLQKVPTEMTSLGKFLRF